MVESSHVKWTSRRVQGHALFFPAAAAYAAFALPASIASMLGLAPPIPGLAFGAGHGHEMLFGFALGVVAGNQLGPTPTGRLAALFGAWAIARVAFLAAPHSLLAALASGIFALLLALQLAPRLFGRAKKARNRALPLTLVALCASALAIQVALHLGSYRVQQGVLLVGLLLLGLLMLFMGGRIIAPAAAGQFYRQGEDLAARVQPRIEGWLIVVMLVAVVAGAIGLWPVAGTGAIAAGLLAVVRMARWRLWSIRGRPDLACLGLGYGWLALGLVGLGVALIAGQRITTALHVITVGSIGTLTINVMALTWARLARRDPARERLPIWATAFIALATLARVFADFGVGEPKAMLLAAAACWSAAYLLLVAFFVRTRRVVARPAGADPASP
jgi:uncharacterized protein involved in response to NO